MYTLTIYLLKTVSDISKYLSYRIWDYVILSLKIYNALPKTIVNRIILKKKVERDFISYFFYCYY